MTAENADTCTHFPVRRYVRREVASGHGWQLVAWLKEEEHMTRKDGVGKRPVTRVGNPCVVAGCAEQVEKGTLICARHAEALRPGTRGAGHGRAT